MALSDTSDSLPISALQHWLFCPRQCALIHVERLWSENVYTAEGRVLHERTDNGRPDTRGGTRILRTAQLASEQHALHGVADVVEMRNTGPYPVEYKRGRPKSHRADEVQLCAQALCLEEMTGNRVPEAAVFYGRNRRRRIVAIDETLRSLTLQVADAARAAVAQGKLPPPEFDARRCSACSLQQLCRPRAPRRIGSDWMSRRIARASVPD